MNLFLSIFFVVISFSAQAKESVKTVDHVDLNRYMGKWYEVASIPQFFQRNCIGNATAEYSLTDDQMVKVLNSCDKKKGREEAEGRAKVVDKDTNSKLKVTFVKIFDWLFFIGGDYWVLDLSDDYSYALVGNPSAKYAWILSRTPSLSEENLRRAHKVLLSNGYDTCEVLTSIQTDGFSERKPLCEVVKNLSGI